MCPAAVDHQRAARRVAGQGLLHAVAGGCHGVAKFSIAAGRQLCCAVQAHQPVQGVDLVGVQRPAAALVVALVHIGQGALRQLDHAGGVVAAAQAHACQGLGHVGGVGQAAPVGIAVDALAELLQRVLHQGCLPGHVCSGQRLHARQGDLHRIAVDRPRLVLAGAAAHVAPRVLSSSAP